MHKILTQGHRVNTWSARSRFLDNTQLECFIDECADTLARIFCCWCLRNGTYHIGGPASPCHLLQEKLAHENEAQAHGRLGQAEVNPNRYKEVRAADLGLFVSAESMNVT